MKVDGEKVLVTGGAGFIGSHLVERLVNVAGQVVVYDNLSTGCMDNLNGVAGRGNFRFVKGDLLNPLEVREVLADCSLVFHLAANPEVRVGFQDTRVDFEQNLVATYNLLEAMRVSKTARGIVFASSSTVYGEVKDLPTPEDYGPMVPISLYGATKLGSEALIMAYCHLFGIKAVIYRFANVVGSRSRHGVVYDFIEKLSRNPDELEVLGDGTQRKSYVHISDCVDAFMFGVQHSDDRVSILNLASKDSIDVKALAEIVIQEMGLQGVKLRFTGGIEGRGWPGDVKEMMLDGSRLERLEWRPRYSSSEAVRLATREILSELSSPSGKFPHNS